MPAEVMRRMRPSVTGPTPEMSWEAGVLENWLR
jgi:hypothetical protein